MTKPGSWRALAAAAIFAVAGLAAFVGTRGPQEQPDRRDFVLQGTDGQAVTLDSFKGKWVLLFFGFTGYYANRKRLIQNR